jgi:hypothetical protein
MSTPPAIWLSKVEQEAVTEFIKSTDAAPLQENSSQVDLKGRDSVVLNFVQKFDLRKKVVCQSTISTLALINIFNPAWPMVKGYSFPTRRIYNLRSTQHSHLDPHQGRL